MPDREPVVHDMTIRAEYYDLVVQGIKTIEARTNDARRKAMQVGDRILLRREASPEEKAAGIVPTDCIELDIVEKIEFTDFTELYNSDKFDKRDCGFEGRTTEDIVNSEIRKFYTPEMERERGAVAIRVKIHEPEMEMKLKPGTAQQ